MLEQFKVPQKDQILVTESALRRCVTTIFGKLGVSADDAVEASDVLVMSDLILPMDWNPGRRNRQHLRTGPDSLPL